MVASSVVDRIFECRSGQTKDYIIGSCCISAKHMTLKSKNWLAGNQDHVTKWCDMTTRGPLFQCASTIQIKQSVLV